MDRSETARRGEDAATAFLERVGMHIEARNWRSSAGEIDIVARDGDELVFVEVKTRRSERAGTAEEAVSTAKQRRIVRLAQSYVAANASRPPGGIRFDVVAIRVLGEDRALLRHYRAAFEATS
ncbi:MAG TPA: YraN family protein [Coriobacteriia bacterium]